VRSAFSGAPAEALESAETPAGERLGEYTLLGKLGEGGMGVVHLARQEPLERLVALKVLPRAAAESEIAAERFEREIRAVARCDDRHVVRILTSGREGETRYYAMEWVGGVGLDELAGPLCEAADFDEGLQVAWSKRRAALKEIVGDEVELPEDAGRDPGDASIPHRLATLLRDAARGLHHMHGQEIVHRDIKPANLVLTVPDRRIVVMDLGLAAVADESRALTRDVSSLLGTLRYMAPEQFQRDLYDIDKRADIYSLGVTFYELLCGRPYRDGDTEARVIQQAIGEEPPPAYEASDSVPFALSAIIEKATQRDPAKRYATAEDLARDVEKFLAEQPTVAERHARTHLARPAAAKGRRALLPLVIGAVAVLAIAVGFLLKGGDGGEENGGEAKQPELLAGQERVAGKDLAGAVEAMLGKVLVRDAWPAERWKALHAACLKAGDLMTAEEGGSWVFDVGRTMAVARAHLDPLAFAAVARGEGFDSDAHKTAANAVETGWLDVGTNPRPRRLSDALVAQAQSIWTARGKADDARFAASLGCGLWFAAELKLTSAETTGEGAGASVLAVVTVSVSALDPSTLSEIGSFRVKGGNPNYDKTKKAAVRGALEDALGKLQVELITLAARIDGK